MRQAGQSLSKASLALAFFVGMAAMGWTQEDIQCYSTKQHLGLPTDCGSQCNVRPKKGENGLAHQNNYCGLEPRCAPLKDADLKALYNRSIPSLNNPTALVTRGGAGGLGIGLLGGLPPAPGRGAASGDALLAARKHLVAYIIDHYYGNGGRGFSSRNVEIQIGQPPKGNDWCQFDREASPGQKRNLWVVPDTFDRSPAFLVSCIGHELVHLEQDGRPIKSVRGITDIRDAFWELEAWTWESGDTNFAWRIGFNKVNTCRTQAEQDDNAHGISCYRWKISRYLEELNTTKRNYLGVFEEWFSHDPWTSQWSRANPNWRSPVPEPRNCE